MTKFQYEIILPTGQTLLADTMRSASLVVNAHFGFKLTTHDIIANLIYRPPTKRPRLPGIVIKRRRRNPLITTLCTSSVSRANAPSYPSPFSSPPACPHTCQTNSCDAALCSQSSSPIVPPLSAVDAV